MPRQEDVGMPQKRIVRWAILVALFAGVTGFFIGQVVAKTPQATAPTPTKQVVASQLAGGRYQIVLNRGVRADTFLIDTQTGKTWVQTEITDAEGQATIWMFSASRYHGVPS
jgi:hypothetical protein